MKLDDIKNLYIKSQKEVEWIHDEQKILTLKMYRHIAKYIGITKEKFLIEEKLEDGKTLSVEDSIKVDHFLPNKKKNIDDFDSLSTKKKTDNRIRVVEMTLNKSEIEVLSKENLEEAENKAALLYAECECLDYRVEDTKEMISLFNKKENSLETEQIKV
ncbi:16808_t:CDS:2 [Gigaspora margarita]|uniref:16808_t:CDS:1 n=1 Tax=Gigaspora margarita TaxID=4874 RepID=A0ABN7VUZ9_GIGMA|nr:16808_t:CDS:2 [Gigaspora margarita]